MGKLEVGFVSLVALACLAFGQARASEPYQLSAVGGPRPNLEGRIDGGLRYRPEGQDFVIRNGSEFFNRSLYGSGTAFRVDGGDRPEFSLYLPGRGGNIRLGIKTARGTIWLKDAKEVEARYRPGELLYVIQDPTLGPKARLYLEVVAYAEVEGAALKVRGENMPAGVQLVLAFGGGNGVRGARDGDIGTERVPISEYFQFKPEYAAQDTYEVTPSGFVVQGKAWRTNVVSSTPVKTILADAELWGDPAGLLNAPGRGAVKIPVATMAFSGAPIILSAQISNTGAAQELDVYRAVTTGGTKDGTPQTRAKDQVFAPGDLASRFEAARQHFSALRNRVRVETPDPYLNAAVGALNVAADATWDEPQQAIMHGAIAWRAKLLGWRGPYSLDALGWHDRARRNIEAWTGRQNTQAIPEALPPADEDANLSRNETGLHSNGDLSNSHYDMNVGFIDVMIRHILWTGDLEFARANWPVIVRHLDWQKRLFRREFGPEKLPLYEAYASIWASDNMQYNGGGVSYQSAYNVYHNRMAARIAALIGEDPKPYLDESDKISKAMRQLLWMDGAGAFAEYKDLLGDQAVHPSYGLWSFYHTLDSEVPTPLEAARMSADLPRHLRAIPIRGKNVPADRAYKMYPSSRWKPYLWSLNNVVMSENLHTALALWQAGDMEEAYNVTLGSVLASMYMGITPGNVGTLNFLDVYRRESMRDFADGSGVLSRAVVEGLFGIQPDALSRRLTVKPGFPKGWSHARLDHPNAGLDYRYERQREVWTLSQPAEQFNTFSLIVPARQERLLKVLVNGAPAKWTALESVGTPQLRVEGAFAKRATVTLIWSGGAIDPARAEVGRAKDPFFQAKRQGQFSWLAAKPGPAAVHAMCELQAPNWVSDLKRVTEPVDLTGLFNDRLTNIFRKGKYLEPRSPYVSLAMPSQGIGAWAGYLNANPKVDDAALRRTGDVSLPGGLKFQTPTGTADNVIFTSRWRNYPREVVVPLGGSAKRAFLLMAGTTNPMQSDFTNGEVVVRYTDGTERKLELRNPETWWPIERDYFIDDYQFRLCGEAPVRFDLKTGRIMVPGPASKGRRDRESIDGGSANVLDLGLDPEKTLASLTVRSTANEVIIGLLALSLER